SEGLSTWMVLRKGREMAVLTNNSSVYLSRTIADKNKTVSTFCFVLFIYFMVDFFLHFSARVPAYGMIRPTLLLVLVISMSLFAQQNVLKRRGSNESFKVISILLAYLFVSV